MRVAVCLALSLVSLRLSLAAAAQPVGRMEVPPYKLIDAVIEGLARANVALEEVNAKSDRASFVDRMTAVQNASIELGVVKRYIQPLTSASNENSATAVASAIDAYNAMQKSLAITLALYDKLDAARSEDDLVGMRRKISDAKVLYQQGSLILIDATGLAFASTVVPDPKDPEHHTALTITAVQKAELIEKLDSRFGSKLREEKQESDTGPLQAARMLLGLLEQDWRLVGN
jgi:hypothetical protein